ncbi:MAG: DUF4377 domain-containing protein [Rhodanobacter sp.]
MNHRLLLTLLPLALAACSPPPASPTSATTTAPTTASTVVAPVVTAAATDADTLRQYHWQLQEATDSSGQRIAALFPHADKPVQLDFNDGRINVSNACNRVAGSYRVEGEKLMVDPMMHTMMACADDALMTLDTAIEERLRDNPTMSLKAHDDAPQLELRTSTGDTLTFNGQATAETRYGSQGETVFLEVAAQTVPCDHPLVPAHQCLNSRELHYDAQGLDTGTPGEWQPLYQPIEGYTHEAGIRNVLRLKRYEIKNPPADASSSAYVLDMVVQSEAVKP